MTNAEALSTHYLLSIIRKALDLPIGTEFSFGFSNGKENILSKDYRYVMPDKVMWAISKSIKNLKAVVKQSKDITDDCQESFMMIENIDKNSIGPENEKDINERYQKYMSTNEDVRQLVEEFHSGESAADVYKLAEEIEWDDLLCPEVIKEFLKYNLTN